MIRVHCVHEPLPQSGKWPTLLPAMPVIGQKIQSSTSLTLEICNLIWVMKDNQSNDWILEIHLCEMEKIINNCKGLNP